MNGKKPPSASASGKAPAAQPDPPKSQAPRPFWATWENVVGYTFDRPLSDADVLAMVKRTYTGTEYPTVYYDGGHRTLKHKDSKNVGWEGKGRHWLFFGNVNNKWLDRDYWVAPGNHSGSKLDAKQRRQFAENLHSAARNLASSPAPEKCTSYIIENSQKWKSDLQHEGLLARGDNRLFEVYEDECQSGLYPHLISHPSRNHPFRWVGGQDQLKQLLHQLALIGAK